MFMLLLKMSEPTLCVQVVLSSLSLLCKGFTDKKSPSPAKWVTYKFIVHCVRSAPTHITLFFIMSSVHIKVYENNVVLQWSLIKSMYTPHLILD